MTYFKYRKVADQMMRRIIEGYWIEGEQIPTEEMLCGLYQAGRQTIRKAVSILADQGYLERIQGSGTYVKKRKSEGGGPGESGRAGGVICLIMPERTSEISCGIVEGISGCLKEKGYRLRIYVTDWDYEKEERALESVLQDAPDGIIMEPVKSGLLSVNEALFHKVINKIPCVFLHTNHSRMFPAVPLHDREGMRRMTDYLISLGHTRIGTIFVFDEMTGQNRYQGVMESMRLHGLHIASEHIMWIESAKKNHFLQDDANDIIVQMLKSVSAVVCQDDQVARELISFLQNYNRKIPDHISVTGYDDSYFAIQDAPAITTIVHPKETYGKNAAEAIISLIRSPDKIEMEKYAIEPKLIIRDSTVAPPKESESC